ncbi:hypothetical protein EH243_08245 [Amphritea opalescens]|uniref:Uncharacterized protein n=1 Tax=Amphritea opalescens TaxID=2490544 RepID=A0A430KRK3_9GAMM|nr:hypothetical protein [Amphritea opalescens]RTE66100.1 hypothetical protein EH243_08245 [Amphritea opalescens]
MDVVYDKIANMIGLLHEKGYADIYIYSGMSASGMYWQYCIGHLDNGRWPNDNIIVQDSVQTEGQVEWSEDTASIEELCDNFIEFYRLRKPGESRLNSDYVAWYKEVLATLDSQQPLAFYADYTASHKDLLRDAPGYSQR